MSTTTHAEDAMHKSPALNQFLLTYQRNDDRVVIHTRHGQKQGDEMTPNGWTQVRHSVIQTLQMIVQPLDLKVGGLRSSGKNRTAQCVMIAQDVLALREAVDHQIDDGLNPFPIIDKVFGGDMDAAMLEIKHIQLGGDTVAYALDSSRYARLCHERLMQAIMAQAQATPPGGVTLGFSHSPYIELVTDKPDETPYGVDEATAMAHLVRGTQIIRSMMIPPPLPGKRN